MRYLFLFFVFLCIFSVPGISQVRNIHFKAWLDSTYKHSVPLITVEELKALPKESIVILDAREGEEYDVSHLKNAIHAGYFWFDMRKLYDIPKDSVIVVYCTAGIRTSKILTAPVWCSDKKNSKPDLTKTCLLSCKAPCLEW